MPVAVVRGDGAKGMESSEVVVGGHPVVGFGLEWVSLR